MLGKLEEIGTSGADNRKAGGGMLPFDLSVLPVTGVASAHTHMAACHSNMNSACPQGTFASRAAMKP